MSYTQIPEDKKPLLVFIAVGLLAAAFLLNHFANDTSLGTLEQLDDPENVSSLE